MDREHALEEVAAALTAIDFTEGRVWVDDFAEVALEAAADSIAAWLQHVDRLSEVPGARAAMPTHNPLWDAAEMIRERFGSATADVT